MAFEDAMIGNSDFDPVAATDDLIRQQSDEPLPSTLEIRDLNTRLARKINQKPQPVETPSPKNKQLDLSQFEPVSKDDGQPLDMSQLEPVDGTAIPTEKPLGVSGQATAFAKGAAHGVLNTPSNILKGAAIPVNEAQPYLASLDYDESGNVINQRPVAPTPPLAQHPLYQAGEAVHQFADKTVPMTPQETESLGGRVGEGLGSVAPYMAAAALTGPAAGIAIGAAGMAATSAGDAFQEAVKKGATEEVAAHVAGLNALVGAAAGGIPLAVVLKPIRIISPEIAGKAAVILNDALQSGIAFAGIGEAQQYLAQKIAKDNYDPKAGYDLDTQRVLASFITGGIVGGFHSAFSGHTPAAEPAPPGTPAAPGSRIPPSGPDHGGPSSPEDIRAFTEEARRTNPNPQPEAQPAEPARPRDPATMDDAELSTAFQEARAEMGDKSLEEILAAGGYSSTTIEQLKKGNHGRDAVEEAIAVANSYRSDRETKAKAGAAPEAATSKPGAQPEQAKPAEPAVPHADYAVLRAYGYSDEDIANMSAPQRKREVTDAFAEGIKPDEAMAKYPAPKAEAATGAPVDRGGAAGTRPEAEGVKPGVNPQPTTTATGVRTDPIVAKTAADVAAAQPVEPKSPAQAEAENYQHAHMEIEHLGLVGEHSISIETGKGQVRKGVDPDGKPWEVKLEDVAYGRIKKTVGADGQPLDIVIGPNPTSPHVFVIDQHHPPTKGGELSGFDEHKIFAGMDTPQEALKAYGKMYADQGGDRIGGATAMTPEQFQAWYKSGNTTKPLSTGPVKTGESGVASTEAGEPVPKETPPAGATEVGGSDATIPEAGESSAREPTQGENIPDIHSSEPTAEHHQQIEDALGADAGNVAVVDIHRAAELLAENEGMDPATAFGQAVIENAVDQGFITPQEAEKNYGPEVKDILDTGREGPSGDGTSVGAKGTEPEQERAGGAEEGRVVPSGSEAGEAVEAVDAAETGKKPAADEHAADAKGGEPAAKPETAVERPAGGEAVEHKPAAETADDATIEGFLDHVEGEIKAGRDNADVAPTTSRADFTKAARERGWIEAAYGKGKALWSADRKNIMFISIPVEGNHLNVQWGTPAEGIKPPAITEPKPKVKEPVTEVEDKARIEDAGEKIGGARKDAWIGRGLSETDLEGMTGAERDKHLTKHNIWERPDYVQAVADGVEPVAAALIKRLYDKLPVKPNSDRSYSNPEKEFIKALGVVRDIVKSVKTLDDAKKIMNAVSVKLSYSEQGVLYPKGARMSPFHFDGADLRAAQQAVDAGFPEMAPWSRLFGVQKAEVWDAEKKAYKLVGFSVYRKNGGRLEGSPFATREVAEAAAKTAYDALGADRKKGGEEPKRPHLDVVTRDGPDYRKGKDVGSENFVKDFGFHGVEFGNYVASDERQKVVNLAYDALHDLARTLNVPPKAMSLGGTLSVAFGARGQGGRAAAHYESDRTVINMTKLSGAGSLAHEWAHALDHYLGELGRVNAYKGSVQSISGWSDTPKDISSAWRGSQFTSANSHLPRKLRSAVNRLMHELFNVEEADNDFETRMQKEIERQKKGQQSWIDRVRLLREAKAKGLSSAGLKQAEEQVEVWGRGIARRERDLEAGERKWMPSNYLKEATKLSGTTGDYWRRPNELFARSFEAYVYDKIAEEGFQSDYLVQGVEPNRYGNGFKGNPFPAGEERKAINAAYDRIVRAISVKEGEHARIESAEGEPEPIATRERVKRPVAQPSAESEAEAVAPTTLPGAFQQHLVAGKGFAGILEARKFAKERGFTDDPKQIEEALELAMVKTARQIIEKPSMRPDETYSTLVSLYEKQPRLGTRTSTSVRDQAYSTPVPLGYLAQRLAGVTKDTTVYEPTAGNGSLLTAADPRKVYANEINPDREKNLKDQGIFTGRNDASEPFGGKKGGYDTVLANPPFGPVKEGGESKVFDLRGVTGLNYKTSEIDHAIALHALSAMKDDGNAVLILGGVNKLVSTPEGRADAYQGQAKRLFYKALYDAYNVTDHFTVDGKLYERQGAAWPVDVIVINGRGKSALPLPAVSAPRIYSSWDELGGLINGQQAASGVRPAGDQAGVTTGGGPGLEGTGRGDRGVTGGEQPGLGEPTGVRGQSGSGAAGAGEGGGVARPRTKGLGASDEPTRSGEQPSPVDDFDAAFDAALDDAYGAPEAPKPVSEKPKPAERSTGDVAKSAGKAALDAADEGFSALYDLFGGNKASMGFTFDPETYEKAKPHFEKAAGRFAEFKNDLGELLKRMVGHLRDALKFTREAMERIKPYLKRFIDDMRAAAEPEPVRKEAIKGIATETENQVTYKPASKTRPLDTLAPVNMAKPMSDALRKLQERVGGSIDQFVADELGMSNNRLASAFGAEQVDALGLAIDNIKNGKGFIIGDQTGIGKGRVNAAIIQWAIKNGRMPVFVTEKPGLYKDMYRDMDAIGVPDFLERTPRILATNASLSLPLEEGKGAEIKTGDAKEHGKHMMKVLPDIDKHYDMVFSTYSQMQTQKGEDTARRQFLQALAERDKGIVVIFDESHNAGGQTKVRKDKSEAMDRAEFARDLIQKANGVFYSSATYAKRPDVMDLYSATNMSMAVDDISDLADAIAHGRIPMQQVVASMLAKDGQYMRRERSFAGINYNTKSVAVNRETYDDVSRGLSAINELSAFTKAAASRMSKEIRGSGGAFAKDNATGGGGASSTNFTSVMHNVINQMLLAIKADEAANHAIALIKAGEKPVMTVANTMEAFMDDYSDSIGIKPGDEMPGDFSDVLRKYLTRTRTVLIKKPFADKKDKPIRHVLTDDELGPAGLAVYNRALEIIDGLDLSGLPISPIDHIKGKLQKAGYSIGEITGRTLAVDYTGKTPIFSKREGGERTTKGKVDTLKRFNTRPKKGGYNALIINQSGSTGLSAHASVDFDDQSKRHMMIVQPEGNIDTHMQLLGRVNRTGQVVLPEYTQMNAAIPAEIRPASVLAKKMASLNANTTASRDSAVTSKEALDFLNEYGDQVAVQWLSDNPEMNLALGQPVDQSDSGALTPLDAMRKVTGRLPLLRLEQQEAVYEEFGSAYKALIERLEAAGENTLEAKSLDLKAKLLEKTEVQGRRNGSGSQFAAPVYMQKVSIARLGKPFKPVEVINKVMQTLNGPHHEGKDEDIAMLSNVLRGLNDPYSMLGKQAQKKETDERQAGVKAFTEYMRPIIDDQETPELRAKKMEQLNAVKDRWVNLHRMMPVGKRVVLKTESGNLTGIVLDVKQDGEPKNPLALGTWKVKVAIADASRQITLPFSQLYETGKSNPESTLDVEVEPMTEWYERHEQTLDRFQKMQTEAREDRYIAGGNMLSAYDWLGHKGAIVNYTAENGSVHQGILTARGFDPGKQAIAKGRITKDVGEVKRYLDNNPSEQMFSKDGYLSLQKDGRYGSDYVVTAEKAKNKGGKYYLDKGLTGIMGDFSSKSGKMIGYLSPRNFDQGVNALMKLGAEFKMSSALQRPMESEGGQEPTLASMAKTSPAGGLLLSPEDRAVVEKAVREAVRRMVGDHVKVDIFDEPMPMPDSAKAAWGDSLPTDTAEGLYMPWRKLIQLALTPDITKTLSHEAYHAIEMQLQTAQERKLMERETPYLRKLIKANSGRYRLRPDEVDRLDGTEIRAIAFEQYAADRSEGMHIGVKHWFHRLLDMLMKLANKLRGLGYKTYEDIFGKAYEGGYRDTAGDTPHPNAEPSFAAIRPGGRRPGPPSPTETIAEHLRDRGYDRMAGLSQKLGIGKANMTEGRVLLQDKFARVKNAERSVDPTLPSAQSTYQAESLYHGRVGERLEQLEETRFDPLIKKLHEGDISSGEFNEYLYAKHAPERNAYIDTINPGLGGAGSGMSDTEAADVINRITRAGELPKYQAAERLARQIMNETRDTMVSYGLISQETADAWAAQYNDYVPLRGFEEGSEDENLVGRGSGYNIKGRESKPAFGRRSAAAGPLQYIMHQAEAAIVRGEKNRVGNTFLRFVRNNPDMDRWQVNAPTLRRRIDPATGLVTTYADFTEHNEPHKFVTKIGGKPNVISLYGKDGLQIARALKNMGASNMSSVVAGLHAITSLQSRLSTMYNPNFLLPNFTRDFGEAFLNLQAQDQQRFVTNFLRHIGPSMKGAFNALRGAGRGERYADAFREFDKAGGRIRFFGLSDPDNIAKNVNRKMRQLQGGAINGAKAAGQAVSHALEIVQGAIENGTRLAAYMAAQDAGMSKPDSAMLARNLTVDFNKKGEWGPAINALYMFGNANLQGAARLLRAMNNKHVRRGAYALAAVGALGALYNILVGGDDDDGDPYYSKIKPYIRDKNLILMWPKGMGHDGDYLKIPLPFGFSPFHVLGDRMAGVALGKDKVTSAASSFLGSVADAFNPLGEESSPWMMLVPSLLRPGIHIAVNRNWTGNPIYPDHDYDKYRPSSTKSFKSNSDFSKAAATTLNSATGGSAYKSGWFDVHPGSIDHVLETATGGLGKFVMDVVKTGGAFIKGEPFDATKAPIIRRFVGSAKDAQSDASSYYDSRDEAKKGGGQNLKAARKDMRGGTNQEAESFVNENPLAGPMEKIFERADKQASHVRKNPSLNDAEKQEQIRVIQNRARKQYKEMKEGATP